MIWFGFMSWKTTLVDSLHFYVYLLFRSVNRFRVGQNIYQSFTTRYISHPSFRVIIFAFKLVCPRNYIQELPTQVYAYYVQYTLGGM